MNTRIITCLAALLLISQAPEARGVSAAGGHQAAVAAVDLIARFKPEGSGDSLKPHVSVMRNGKRVDATVLVAPARARLSLADFAGQCTLKMLAAPVFNLGDGMLVELILAVSGVRSVVFSRYVDAGRKAGDRAWIPVEVSLDLPRTREVYLEIQVSGGPQGDLVADWLALGEAQLLREKSIR
jgi:hypothetical protein